MDSVQSLKYTCEDLSVEFDILPPVDPSKELDPRKARIYQGLASVEEQLAEVKSKIDELTAEENRLTNQADSIDYAIAVVSGIFTGIIDAIFVGEWDFEKAKAASNEAVDNKVINFAKKDPRYIPWCESTAKGKTKRDPDRLESAIEFLEEHYHLPGDSAYQSGNFGIGGKSHRLDDFCHHPTIIGLLCCIIVQFTGSTVYSPDSGGIVSIPIEVNDYGKFVGKNFITKAFAGIINWFFNVAGAIKNRRGHLMSDMATSAGIPGPLLSTLKELSALPCFANSDFAKSLKAAYQSGIGTGAGQLDLGIFNSLFSGASSKFDMRTEHAVGHELKRQAMPVILNELLVRSGYFIRRFIAQMKEKKALSDLNWQELLPFKNRTIVRMMTIASGTFTVVDMTDAAIETAVKKPDSLGNPAAFLSNMILRVNFVGIGRFVIAVGTDVGMGIKRSRVRNQCLQVYSEQIALTNAKVFYKQAEMWIAAESVSQTLAEAFDLKDQAFAFYIESVQQISKDLNEIGTYAPKLKEKNLELTKDILDMLDWM